MGVFTELARRPADLDACTGASACTRARRAISSTRWWRSASSQRSDGNYANTPETDLFLDQGKPSYVGGILEMANHRLYPFWGTSPRRFAPASRRTKSEDGGPEPLRDALRRSGAAEGVPAAMTGISHGANMTIARSSRGQNYTDVRRRRHRAGRPGGADRAGQPASAAASASTCPRSRPIFEEYVARNGVAGRVQFGRATSSATRCRRPTWC